MVENEFVTVEQGPPQVLQRSFRITLMELPQMLRVLQFELGRSPRQRGQVQPLHLLRKLPLSALVAFLIRSPLNIISVCVIVPSNVVVSSPSSVPKVIVNWRSHCSRARCWSLLEPSD
jgi:hypothetical protein